MWMRISFVLLLSLLVAACATDRGPRVGHVAASHAQLPDAGAVRPFAYPPSRRVDARDVMHGVEVPDPYRWLEDGSSDEVKRWMRDQDSFASSEVAKLPMRAVFASRMKELALQEQAWPPEVFGGRLFHQRRSADRERAVIYVREGSADRALIDPDALAPDKSIFIGNWWPSWDGKKIVYQARRKNADAATLYVVDVATSKVSDVDVLEGAEWPVVQWTPKSDAFYYQWVSPDPSVRPKRFAGAEGRLHKLGDPQSRDVVVREPVAGQAGCPLFLDSRGRWLVAWIEHGWGKNDLYFEDLREAHPRWRMLVEGRDAAFDVQVYKDVFYVRTTDGAPRGALYAADPKKPERAAWKRIVDERDATLVDFQVLGGHLVLRYLEDVVTRIEVRTLDGAFVRAFPKRIGEHGWITGNADADAVYFSVHSYDRPREIFTASIATGAETIWYRTSAPADFSKLVVEQVLYESKGTKIPMFVFRRRDLVRDGSAPMLLSGYGAANAKSQPNYSPLLLPWVERGGVYAWPALRGGGEYGEAWHRAGYLRNKQTTFDDFIAAAEYLVREKYTRPERLAIRGATWGGLLVTAAMTQRPDLFGAVIALVPQTDMVRFPLTGLGSTPILEFGDPANADDFRALFAYSPYHHVTPGTRYPATLVSAAESDERVDALHARKFVAALQGASTGGEVLLRVDWDQGHLGSGFVSPEVAKRAQEYAFALAAMRLDK